jgi:hypothetical protein
VEKERQTEAGRDRRTTGTAGAFGVRQPERQCRSGSKEDERSELCNHAGTHIQTIEFTRHEKVNTPSEIIALDKTARRAGVVVQPDADADQRAA